MYSGVIFTDLAECADVTCIEKSQCFMNGRV